MNKNTVRLIMALQSLMAVTTINFVDLNPSKAAEEALGMELLTGDWAEHAAR